MIEVGRPGFDVTSAGVVPDDMAGIGPDAVIVHSTDSGKFLPTSRQEMQEFINAAAAGVFDGVLLPDIPLHPSASAAAPCPAAEGDQPDITGMVFMLIDFDSEGNSVGRSWAVDDPMLGAHLRHLTTHLGAPLTDATNTDLDQMYERREPPG